MLHSWRNKMPAPPQTAAAFVMRFCVFSLVNSKGCTYWGTATSKPRTAKSVVYASARFKVYSCRRLYSPGVVLIYTPTIAIHTCQCFVCPRTCSEC